MQIIDLFSGIGGFSVAGKRMGWNTVQFVERDKFCQRVLRYHFPDAAIHDDIKTFTLEILKKSRYDPAADTIVCGGFPCQPFSVAGKRKGTADDRYLWPEMLRAIREIRPQWVVGENVRGLVNWNGGLVFEQVLADLEACDYEILPFLLPACGVNAPHRRERIFIIAHARGERLQKYESGTLSNTNRDNTCPSQEQRQQQGGIRTIGENEVTSYADIKQSAKWDNNGIQTASDTTGIGMEGCGAAGQQIPRSSTETSIPRSNFTGTNWDKFPTQFPVCQRNDGFSSQLSGITFPKWRQESLKALGNAVVPGLVYEIFKAINKYEK